METAVLQWYDLEELADDISQFYQLSEFVSDRLEFHYATHSRSGQRKKRNQSASNDAALSELKRITKDGAEASVTLDDLALGARMGRRQSH